MSFGLPPDSAETAPCQHDGRSLPACRRPATTNQHTTAADKLRLNAGIDSLDRRTTRARTTLHLAAAFKRALGDRYSEAMRPLVEAAAMAAAIAADLQARMLAGDPSVSINDTIRAVNAARCARLDLALPGEPDKPPVKRPQDVLAEHLAERRAAMAAGVLSQAPL
jgi:hypothetical protein